MNGLMRCGKTASHSIKSSTQTGTGRSRNGTLWERGPMPALLNICLAPDLTCFEAVGLALLLLAEEESP